MISDLVKPTAAAADPAPTKPLLMIENLSVEIASSGGKLKAINDVNLDLFPGETLALVGESGSGKSLTSLSVARLLPRSLRLGNRSSIRFRRSNGDAVDLASASDRTLRAIRGMDLGFVFQEPLSSLNPVLRIGEQIAEPIVAHMGLSRTDAWARVVELLDHVGIPDAKRRATQYPHEFSGGMSQRATIAMAIACNPGMLIADEPTTALDVTMQAQILDLMQSLQRESGMAMLFVTHNFGVVAQIAQRVAVMYAGYVVEYGTVKDVFARPRHPYTIGLLGCIAAEGQALKLRQEGKLLPSIPGTVPSIANRPRGCPFAPRCAHAQPACDDAVPPLEPTGSGTASRCIRWREF